MNSHRCNFHQICLDLKSEYRLELDATHHYIGNQSIYFVPRGTIINWKSDYTDRWKGYTIFFKPNFLTSPNKNLTLFQDGVPRVLSIDEKSRDILTDLAERMLEELQRAESSYQNVLQHLLALFLIYSERYYQLSKSTSGSFEFQVKYQFIDLLNFNIDKHHKVEYYAKTLHLSSRNFSRIIKKTTGKAPKQIIIEKLVEVAQERIKNSNATISEIALSLNFKNTPQFNKHFKTLTGYSPTVYRKLNASTK
ncbi:MAG: AraC family transcriptional regulator [Bacteroidota bacterium]